MLLRIQHIEINLWFLFPVTSPVQSQIFNLFFHSVLQRTHSDIFSVHL